jgi:hypothetical protein
MPISVSLRRNPSALLLALQLVSLVLFPLMDNSQHGQLVFAMVGAIALAPALWVVNRSPAVNWIAWLLAGSSIVLTIAALVLDRSDLLAHSQFLEGALYLYTAGALIAYMLHDHEVSADELFAAGATFTLLAWAFGYAYLVCQYWYPDSFVGLRAPGEPRTAVELWFLSFTTLSGVGLGDVLPIAPQARVLVMLEEFAGVGYIAAIVSRLIGLTIRYR